MNKQIVSTFSLDKTKALSTVKPFYGALFHFVFKLITRYIN
jgi:hypothetical protein